MVFDFSRAETGGNEKRGFDIYGRDNSDNCSDREYMDDDDYDDFDG